MKWKFLFIGLVTTLYLTSCAPKTLYSWSNYDDTSYKYLKNSDEKSMEQLIKTYRQLIEKQTGTRKAVPPGVYADYGFVLLQSEKTEEGKAMLEKEISLYPESKIFIDRILQMFEK
ncbi:MAG: DUF4810 domain-containing protein [Dysgonamonadaceae bacterium]|jgi:hypothetical protein|nr:DUF4810 domain-containing protein [Dysgonamonadaceae bacterium]